MKDISRLVKVEHRGDEGKFQGMLNTVKASKEDLCLSLRQKYDTTKYQINNVHPNLLTAWAVVVHIVGLWLFIVWHEEAWLWTMIWARGLDGIDGRQARRINKETDQGKELDALADKIKDWLDLTAICVLTSFDPQYMALTWGTLAVHIISTRMRRKKWYLKFLKQALLPPFWTPNETKNELSSNMYWKIKTTLLSIGIPIVFYEMMDDKPEILNLLENYATSGTAKIMITGGIIAAGVSISKKIRDQKAGV